MLTTLNKIKSHQQGKEMQYVEMWNQAEIFDRKQLPNTPDSTPSSPSTIISEQNSR